MEQDRRQILPYHLQWFAKDGPGGEKTEPATAKKLREAREDGKVAKSKELTAAFDLIVMFLMLKIFVSTIGDGFLQIFYYVYNLIPDFSIIKSLTHIVEAHLQITDHTVFMILIQTMVYGSTYQIQNT